MSRHRDSEQPFGSDSFLDIVANIVGILIILIVIAGVRLRMSPRRLPPEARIPVLDQTTEESNDVPLMPLLASDPEPEPEPEPPVPTMGVAEVAEESTPERDRPEPEPPPLPPPPDVPEVQVRDDLRRQAADLEREIAALRQKVQQKQAAAERESRELLAAKASLAEAEESLKKSRASLQAEQKILAELKRDLQATVESVLALRRQIDETDVTPETEVIEHRVTPLGRVVNGQELHYLLQGNRVVPVPVDELARKLHSQIQRKKQTLVKLQQYEGTVGPIGGFEMRYRIEKVRLSLAEELKYGQSVVRMNVTRWSLLPVEGILFETAEEALRRGSKFYESLLQAGPLTTITLWVYPDSFGLSREIQAFAHRHGYEVAARPLPFGVPITGSPDGSKSVAQ